MGQEIGQSSRHQPAVVRDGSLFHMAFSANDNTNRNLYAISPDGLSWTLGADTGQTSGAAPVLTVSQLIRVSIGICSYSCSLPTILRTEFFSRFSI